MGLARELSAEIDSLHSTGHPLFSRALLPGWVHQVNEVTVEEDASRGVAGRDAIGQVRVCACWMSVRVLDEGVCVCACDLCGDSVELVCPSVWTVPPCLVCSLLNFVSKYFVPLLIKCIICVLLFPRVPVCAILLVLFTIAVNLPPFY